MSSSTIYVGSLPGDIKESEVDDLFYKYGKIVSIDVKNAQPGGNNSYCFVEFGHPDDAHDAVKAMDGRNMWGKRLRVELSHRGQRGGGVGGGRDGGYGGGGGGYGGRYERSYRDRPYERRGGGGGGGGGGASAPRRTQYRVCVTGLPPTCSWQDLKDHMRKGGEVTFAQVMRDGDGLMGLVDYATADDLRTAIRNLNDSEFRNPFDKCYIRVREDTGGPAPGEGRGRSSSRSPRRSRSPRPRRSRSPRRSVSPDRSASPRRRSRSPPRRSASPQRSRSPPKRGRSPGPRRSRSRSRSRSVSRSPGR